MDDREGTKSQLVNAWLAAEQSAISAERNLADLPDDFDAESIQQLIDMARRRRAEAERRFQALASWLRACAPQDAWTRILNDRDGHPTAK
jgi:hypothetical protein